jgi:hypothetical protein
VCDLDDGIQLIWMLSDGTVAWQPEANFLAYDLYRGDLDVLRATGDYTQDPAASPLAYRQCGIDAASWPDDAPPVGKGFFYQVLSYFCPNDVLGLGNDSSGALRPNTWACAWPDVLPCPEFTSRPGPATATK